MALKKKTDNGFAEAVEEVEEQSLRQINTDTPVTDEDGYVHEEPMLYGYKDPETGILHNTFSYREMDGRDEEAISKGDVRSNGAKLSNILVERCVSQIGDIKKKDIGPKAWGDLVRRLYGGDIDYMVLKIRAITKGKIVTFTHKCPNCNTKLTTEVSCDEFKTSTLEGNEEIPFTLPGRGYRDSKGGYHKEGTIRLMNGYDRELVTPVMAKNRANGVTSVLTRIMTFNDGTPVFAENVKSMSVKDRDYLEKLHNDNNFGVDMSLEDVQCTVCGNDLSDSVVQSDFF